jgi:hypothetical protein
MTIPAQTKRQVGLIKRLWQEDKPADGFRKLKVKRYDWIQVEEFLTVIRFYEIEDKTAKVRERMFVQHTQAAYMLAFLWERRGRALERHYAFRIWTPTRGVDHKVKTLYDAPMRRIPHGPAFQLGLARTHDWNQKFMNAKLPF